MPANRDEFFAEIAKPLAKKVVSYAGKEYLLQQMNEETGAEFELMLQSKKGFDMHKYRRCMISMMLVDSEGNRLVDDESKLKGMSRAFAGFLFHECTELDGYKSGEVEELIKNSEPVEG